MILHWEDIGVLIDEMDLDRQYGRFLSTIINKICVLFLDIVRQSFCKEIPNYEIKWGIKEFLKTFFVMINKVCFYNASQNLFCFKLFVKDLMIPLAPYLRKQPFVLYFIGKNFYFSATFVLYV